MIWSFWITLIALCFWPLADAIIFSFFVGFSKEVWDHFYGSGFCVFDLAGNGIGMTVAVGVYILVSADWALNILSPLTAMV